MYNGSYSNLLPQTPYNPSDMHKCQKNINRKHGVIFHRQDRVEFILTNLDKSTRISCRITKEMIELGSSIHSLSNFRDLLINHLIDEKQDFSHFVKRSRSRQRLTFRLRNGNSTFENSFPAETVSIGVPHSLQSSYLEQYLDNKLNDMLQCLQDKFQSLKSVLVQTAVKERQQLIDMMKNSEKHYNQSMDANIGERLGEFTSKSEYQMKQQTQILKTIFQEFEEKIKKKKCYFEKEFRQEILKYNENADKRIKSEFEQLKNQFKDEVQKVNIKLEDQQKELKRWEQKSVSNQAIENLRVQMNAKMEQIDQTIKMHHSELNNSTIIFKSMISKNSLRSTTQSVKQQNSEKQEIHNEDIDDGLSESELPMNSAKKSKEQQGQLK